MSKSGENSFGAASRAVLVGGRSSSLPQSEPIVASGGLEVCDGAHRLGVMKRLEVAKSPEGWAVESHFSKGAKGEAHGQFGQLRSDDGEEVKVPALSQKTRQGRGTLEN